MTGYGLRDRFILVVEDEYLLADELHAELCDAGAQVLGPVGNLDGAIALVKAEPHIDGAVLDVNLRGEWAYPVADLLAERGVPFIFTTGYDDATMPDRVAQVMRCDKPVSMAMIARGIGEAADPATAPRRRYPDHPMP